MRQKLAARELLLEHDADPSLDALNDNFALSLAIANCHVELAKILFRVAPRQHIGMVSASLNEDYDNFLKDELGLHKIVE
jgi:hypothetical protein